MKWLLPALFIVYYSSISLFMHVHVENGTTIVHSHPFKKGSEHSHTTVEFQLIHLLNHVLVTDSGLIPTFAVAALSLLCILFIRPQVEPYHRSCPGVISLRAPPVAQSIFSGTVFISQEQRLMIAASLSLIIIFDFKH